MFDENAKCPETGIGLVAHYLPEDTIRCWWKPAMLYNKRTKEMAVPINAKENVVVRWDPMDGMCQLLKSECGSEVEITLFRLGKGFFNIQVVSGGKIEMYRDYDHGLEARLAG